MKKYTFEVNDRQYELAVNGRSDYHLTGLGVEANVSTAGQIADRIIGTDKKATRDEVMMELSIATSKSVSIPTPGVRYSDITKKWLCKGRYAGRYVMSDERETIMKVAKEKQ